MSVNSNRYTEDLNLAIKYLLLIIIIGILVQVTRTIHLKKKSI